MDVSILLGYEVGTGHEVRMKLHHTVITGMTQLSGKTTAMEAIISRADRRAIAFKTKRGESGFNAYREIPPFFRQRADWQYVASLLEAVLHEKMRFERPWIMRATKNTSTLREVMENVQGLLADASGTTLAENVYTALEEYLKIVVPQIERFEFSKTLELGEGINVMDLTQMSVELQSLVVQSTMEFVITNLRDVILIIPEAWEHLPQGRNTPVKLYAETFIRKGAAIGNYLFIDSQDIAGIDKTPLRQCNNWILGRQREGHEVERVREQLGKKIDADEIRGLALGQFYAILGDDTRKVYVLPVGVPAKVGKKVALGETPVGEAARYIQEARQKRTAAGSKEKPQAKGAAPRQGILRVLGGRKGGEELERHLNARDEEVQVLRGEVGELRRELGASNSRIQELLKKLEAQETRANTAQVPTGRLGFSLDDLNMLVDQRIHQIIKYDRPTIMTTVDVSGGFRDVIKERFVQQIASKIRGLPEQAAYAAMLVHEKGSVDRGDLYSFLTGEQGRIPPEFYDTIRLLEEGRLVQYSKETGLVTWSLGEHIAVELHQLYDEATRKQAEEYLASLLMPAPS